jgi:hypothetical protein
MPQFGFDRKEQPQSFATNITNKEDLKEIKEISIGTKSYSRSIR